MRQCPAQYGRPTRARAPQNRVAICDQSPRGQWQLQSLRAVSGMPSPVSASAPMGAIGTTSASRCGSARGVWILRCGGRSCATVARASRFGFLIVGDVTVVGRPGDNPSRRAFPIAALRVIPPPSSAAISLNGAPAANIVFSVSTRASVQVSLVGPIVASPALSHLLQGLAVVQRFDNIRPPRRAG
jgi:hypothetical protein